MSWPAVVQALRLTKYRVEWVFAESSDPGDVIYEDEFQVGMSPYTRSRPSPPPPVLSLGPTSSASSAQRNQPAGQFSDKVRIDGWHEVITTDAHERRYEACGSSLCSPDLAAWLRGGSLAAA